MQLNSGLVLSASDQPQERPPGAHRSRLERHVVRVDLPAVRPVAAAKASKVDRPPVAGHRMFVPSEEMAVDPVPHDASPFNPATRFTVL